MGFSPGFRLLKLSRKPAHSLTAGTHLSPPGHLGVLPVCRQRRGKAVGSRTGTIPENPGGEYPWALKPGKVQDPSGWGAGNRMGAPWLLPLTPRGHLEVHEAYANVSHGVQNGNQSQTNRPGIAQGLYLWPAGSSKSALHSCHGNCSAWFLKARVGGEGRWRRHSAAFLEKPICFFPQETSLTKTGGRGEGGRRMGIGSRERKERKDSKMLQEQLS